MKVVMKSKLAALGVMVVLAGCGAAIDRVGQTIAGNDPIIVIAPGYKVFIDGQATPIFGFDECLNTNSTVGKLFGDSPDAGSHDCIVIENERQSVQVRFMSSTGVLANEKWQIVREQGTTGDRHYLRTSLKRPNGSLVVAS